MNSRNSRVGYWFSRLPKIPRWFEYSILAVFAGVFLILGFGIIWATLAPIPTIDNFQNREVAQSTKIYDRTGNIVLYDVHGNMRRTAVPLEDISPYIQHAAIAVEDATFYTNAGFRPTSFVRAAIANLLSHSYQQGGSTITQQVVKNALLTQKKTILRKIEEIILALRLTRTYSKDKILNTYLNETTYGGTIYGVQEASQYFFGVDAKDVDLAQAAYLAALPQAPTYYSPYGNHLDALTARKNFVLQQMKANGFIGDSEFQKAVAEKVTFVQEVDAGIKAPHFVFYIRDYLEQKYGADAVASGGLKVITTLDYDLQKKAEDTVASFAPNMQKNFDASNEAMVAIDPKTGQILTMVGSRGYFDNTIDGKVNVALANRQPGSSFKPFVYATAYEKGYTPDTVVFDLQTQFSTNCDSKDVTNDIPPCYSPQNFDGTFHGPISLRSAISISDNVASVKVLYLAGVSDSITTAQSMGITTLGDAGRYGLTLVLGGGEVNLLDLTSAYGVFANDGVRNPATGILRVEDSAGNVLEQYEDQSARVLDPQIARLTNDVLSDNVARTPEFGADSPLYFSGYDVADKTGTTNDYRDVWVLGYTPGISVGAWAGNNDNSPMQKKIAAFIIAPMWHDFMSYALSKYPSDSFVPPSPETNPYSIPPVLSGNWNTDPTQGIHDILYWVDKSNPRGGKPANPASDPQFQYWDYPVQLWAAQNPGMIVNSKSTTASPVPPVQVSDFTISSPQQGAVIPWGAVINATIQPSPNVQVSSVSYYLNGSLTGTTSQPPYFYAISPMTHGTANLRAVVQKVGGGTSEQTVTFTIQ